jgi:hypothetical protein
MHLKTVTIILFFALFSCQLPAQTIIHGKNDIWLFNLLNHKINDKWSLGNELHFRMDDYFKDRQQILIRPFANYHLSDKVILTSGYSFILTSPYGDFPLATNKAEHNLWTQALLKNQIGKWNLAHRYRLENRWQGNIVELNETYEVNDFGFSNRFRYRFDLRRDIKGNLFLHLFDELWVKETNTFQQINYDRNWLYAGLGWKMNKRLAIEVAYLHQYVRNNDSRFENHHTLQISTILNF